MSSASHSSALFVFLGGAVWLGILLILIVIFWNFTKTREILMRLLAQTRDRRASQDNKNLRVANYFDFHTLKKATKNFDPSNLLGRGGFGPVYQGKLADRTMVAVKILSLDKSQQGELEFLSEVKMISNIQHKNLVQLLGCCSEGSQRLLVYEYMKNKSLDFTIYGKSEQFLNWDTRYQIILGIARGLQYLHEDSNMRIVHRDIKASNILIDDKFQPKIGDFGLARFFPEDQDYLSTNLLELCYTAPEYAIRGELSEKADIYSFGVVVLEIISSRKNTDLTLPSEKQYLPEYAWKLYEKSRIIELVDPRLMGEEEGNIVDVKKDVLQVMNVAFLCIEANASKRPPMSMVVAMLTLLRSSTCSKFEMPTPTRPVFLDRRRNKDENLSWDIISDSDPPFPSPSPLITHSSSLPQPPNC